MGQPEAGGETRRPIWEVSGISENIYSSSKHSLRWALGQRGALGAGSRPKSKLSPVVWCGRDCRRGPDPHILPDRKGSPEAFHSLGAGKPALWRKEESILLCSVFADSCGVNIPLWTVSSCKCEITACGIGKRHTTRHFLFHASPSSQTSALPASPLHCAFP